MSIDRNVENDSVLKYKSPSSSPSPSILHIHHLSFLFSTFFLSIFFFSAFSHHTLKNRMTSWKSCRQVWGKEKLSIQKKKRHNQNDYIDLRLRHINSHFQSSRTSVCMYVYYIWSFFFFLFLIWWGIWICGKFSFFKNKWICDKIDLDDEF